MLTGSCDSTVRLFDRRTGREIHCLRGHKGIVMSVAFDPRGRQALSGGWDGTVRVWDLDTGKQTVQFDGHSGQVWCVACSPGRPLGGIGRNRLRGSSLGHQQRRGSAAF